MKWEEQVRQLMNGEMGKSLQSIMNSETGKALAKKMDGNAVEAAAKAGDTQALASLLKNMLETPEGKVFAEQVRKTVKHGE